MAEFSPGKWEIDTSRDSLLICAPTPDGYKTLVAYAYTWENARLIATAPELFDIVHALAECQPHQFSSLKLRARQLLNEIYSD